MEIKEEPYFRELSEKEKQGVAGIREKLKEVESEYPEAKQDVANLLRFLRARDFNVDESSKMLISCLKWRKEFHPELITEKDVPNEFKTGKAFWLPVSDKKGRPVLVVFGGLHEPWNRNLEETKKYIIQTLESGFQKMPPGGDGQYLLIYDRLGFERKHFDLEVIRECGNVLSNYYPERLAEFIVLRANWLFHILWNVARHFMDARTVNKIKLIGSDIKDPLLEYFDEGSLWYFYGGKYKWDFQINNYQKLLGAPPDVEPSKEEEEKLEEELQKLAIQ